MKINLDFKKKLECNGFVVIPLFDIIPFLNIIREDILNYFDFMSKSNSGIPINEDNSS